jgi:hypothetical protein
MDIYKEHKPYTYLIGWSNLNKYYYGVRYAKKCHPSDLWTKYFTSSKTVKMLRATYGNPDVIEVRKVFDSVEKAISWETSVISKMNMLHEEKWLNMNCAGAIYISHFSKEHKQKISESNKGKHKSEHALYASKVAKEINTGKKRPEHSQTMKEFWKAKSKEEIEIFSRNLYSKLKGKPKSEKSKEKIKKSIKNRSKVCCIKCHKPSETHVIFDGIWTCHYGNHHRNC